MNTNAKHTAGPWKSIGRAIVTHDGRIEIAVASMNDTGDSHVDENHRVNKLEAFSNAKLIANAPTMLEALKKIAEHPKEFYDIEDFEKMVCEMEAIAKDAIAQAEGGAK